MKKLGWAFVILLIGSIIVFQITDNRFFGLLAIICSAFGLGSVWTRLFFNNLIELGEEKLAEK